jgi:phosphatidylserine synthase
VTSNAAAYLLMGYCATIAGLMVSQISYPSIKHIRVDSIDRRLLFLAICLAVFLAWYSFEMSLLIGTVAYAASGPAQCFAAKMQKGSSPKTNS